MNFIFLTLWKNVLCDHGQNNHVIADLFRKSDSLGIVDKLKVRRRRYGTSKLSSMTYHSWTNDSISKFFGELVIVNLIYQQQSNKAGYTANTSCGRVGRGGNACFHTFRLVLTDGRTDILRDGLRDGPTVGSNNKQRVAADCNQSIQNMIYIAYLLS